MKHRGAILATFVTAVVLLIALSKSSASPLLPASELSSTATAFISPIVNSPLLTPSVNVLTDRAKWLFAHDAMDARGQKAAGTAPGGLLEAAGEIRTSDFMLGRVVVAIIMPESDGSLMPSSENWRADDISFVTSEIGEALQWWQQQATGFGANVEFTIAPGHPLQVATGYEPIQMIGLEESFGDTDDL